MNDIFNRVKILKSGEDCYKFSKSVLHETLVGGTATTGREYKQNQRLSACSANKPLSAVGTLTSLLCNSAKVVEKLLQMSPVFRLIKIFGLVMVLSVGVINESWAECDAKTNTWMKLDCYTAWNPGAPDNCGAGCTYNYNNGKLTVTATKPGAVISEGIFAPSYYDEKADFPNITNIEIAGEFETIGKHAFLGNGATLSGKNGILYVNNLNHNPFDSNTLIGTIIVNDKQNTLSQGPWYLATLNATVILPSTITSIKWAALRFLRLGENAKIYCGAENCEEMFRNVNCDEAENSYYKERCKNNLKTLLSSGKLLPYPDGCSKMGATGCTKCKNENFKLNDGECDRLRWTPAEAAKVLKDDNTNSVTITFRK